MYLSVEIHLVDVGGKPHPEFAYLLACVALFHSCSRIGPALNVVVGIEKLVVSLDAAVPEYILAAADRLARIQQEGNGPQNCSVLIDVMDGVWHTEGAAMPCAKFHQMPFDDD
jgi:hypothetical protein